MFKNFRLLNRLKRCPKVRQGGLAIIGLALTPSVLAAYTADDFVMTVQTLGVGETFTIPTRGGGYNYNVDCDNDSTDDFTAQAGDVTCTYPAAGTHTVVIKDNTGGGTGFPWIYFNGAGDEAKVLTIEQWGTGQWSSMERAFRGASQLEVVATDVPDLSNVTTTFYMFLGASSLTGTTGNWNWDTSNIETMSSMFYGTQFNGDVSNWNVSSGRLFNNMFRNVVSFNQDISGWNMSSAQNLDRMLAGATSFNQNLGGWDVRNVTTMFLMLQNAGLSNTRYDQTLAGWSTQTLQVGVNLGADNLNYCSSDAQRTSIATTYTWNITGDSLDCTGANYPPTNITLDGADSDTVSENEAVGTVVGTLATTDADAGDTHTYSLACASAGGDDGHFQIVGDALQTKGSFDFEAPSDANTDGTYELCVRTDDGNGWTFDKNLTVVLQDVDETVAGPVVPPAVKSVATSSRGRYAGQTRAEYAFSQQWEGKVSKHNFAQAYDFSLQQIAQLDAPRAGEVLTYTNAQGQERFLAYRAGKVGLEKFSSYNPKQVVWRQRKPVQAVRAEAGFLAAAPTGIAARLQQFYRTVVPSLKTGDQFLASAPKAAKPVIQRTTAVQTIINRRARQVEAWHYTAPSHVGDRRPDRRPDYPGWTPDEVNTPRRPIQKNLIDLDDDFMRRYLRP